MATKERNDGGEGIQKRNAANARHSNFGGIDADFDFGMLLIRIAQIIIDILRYWHWTYVKDFYCMNKYEGGLIRYVFLIHF